MKKAFLLSALAVVAALAFTSCNKETPDNPYYPRKFAVKNDTDKTITVTGDPESGWLVYNTVTIAPGERRLVAEDYISGGMMYGEANYGYGSYDGSGDDSYDLDDYYMKDDLKPDFCIPYGEDSGLDMTVGETAAPVAIWQRKYWDFLPDYEQVIYTLTVTDELLASLTPAQPDPSHVPQQQ